MTCNEDRGLRLADKLVKFGQVARAAAQNRHADAVAACLLLGGYCCKT